MPDSVPIIRRLHVSGLTPAISHHDLDTRFAAFGNVKAIDGYGKLDALGQPRKYAYISLEASSEKHSKCLNVLSGSTWKGAKLRIGEAKPDYAQRLEKERLQEVEPKIKRRRLARGVHGTESKDMSIITPENVDNHSGWKRTSLSHLVYPVRMRPLHPIGRPQPLNSSNSRKKKKKVVLLTRARRQKIDPTRFGAVHLTEDMLQAEHVVVLNDAATNNVQFHAMETNHTKRQEKIKEISEDEEASVPPSTLDTYQAEKAKDLSLLAQLFDGKDEWAGREDDIDELQAMSEDGEYEKNAPTVQKPPPSDSSESSGTEEDMPSEEHAVDPESTPTSPKPSSTRLKDLFSTPIQSHISILAGLDLDLALDDDLAFDTMPFVQPIIDIAEPPPGQTGGEKPPQKRHALEGLQMSTTAPFFFPLAHGERSRGTVKDIMAISQTRGWMDVLLNQPSSEQIKSQWDKEKIQLTRDWKQRHREAIKRSRRGAPVFNGLD